MTRKQPDSRARDESEASVQPSETAPPGSGHSPPATFTKRRERCACAARDASAALSACAALAARVAHESAPHRSSSRTTAA
jgi:hypothetical protein